MNKNIVVFIVLASLVLMTASILQTMYAPPKPDVAQSSLEGAADSGAAASDADQGESETQDDGVDLDDDTAALKDKEPSDGQEASLSEGSAENSDSADEEENQSPQTETDSDGSDASRADSASDPTDQSTESSDVDTRFPRDLPLDQRLITVGSVAADSPYRYLVTLDRLGGSIRRIELNTRWKKNRLKYRDLEHRGGYLGELEPFVDDRGVVVGACGHGTPAHEAGIRQGDVLTAFEGEPIASRDDYFHLLEDTKTGQTITLEYRPADASATRTATITLTDKPMEMVRPEPDRIDPGWVSPNSFLLTLRQRTNDDSNWPEVDPLMRQACWVANVRDERHVVFEYEVTNDKMAALGMTGPIRVTKTFTVPEIDPELLRNTDSPTFDLGFDLNIENLSQAPVSLAFQLNGPTGAPSEGWWYQNKIHGRSSAIGYIAGARDVIGSSPAEPFKFYGCPEIVKNQLKDNPKHMRLFLPGKTPDYQIVNWACVDTQYFNVALIPNDDNPFQCYTALAMTTGAKIPDNGRLQKLVDCTFYMFSDALPLDSKGGWQHHFSIFAGPKEPDLLQHYGLGSTRVFGWFAWFSKPLCWLLETFYTLTFQLTYAIPIILLTVLVRSFMIPVSRKAAMNAQMMQFLQPKIKEIAEKYKDDMEKRSQAQQALFKKYNYNPFGGCLMMFIQLPIFIGLYRGLSVDIALRDQSLIPGLNWCTNLAAPDQFLYWKDWMPGFLADETGWLGPYLNILPIVTIVLFLAQQKLFMPPPTDEQQIMMQRVMKFMMVFMGVLFFKVPSGLCLYFITSSIWGIVERKLLPKPQLDTSALESLDDEAGTKRKFFEGRSKPKQQPVVDERAKLEEKRRQDRDRQKRLKQRDRLN